MPNFLIRGHDLRNNGLSFGRVLFGDVIDCAHRRTAAQPFSRYKDNLTICHAALWHDRTALSTPITHCSVVH